MAPRRFLCAEAQELINGLLQHPDARAGLQISVSMCLLFDGWCFNILDLNRGRSAWWGLAHGYSGAQPGAPGRRGDWERRDGDRKPPLSDTNSILLQVWKLSMKKKKRKKIRAQPVTRATMGAHNAGRGGGWTVQGLEQSRIKGPGARRWKLTSLTPSSPIPHQGGT